MSYEEARTVIDAALSQGRRTLSEHEAKRVLAAYDIPVTREVLVTDPADANADGRAHEGEEPAGLDALLATFTFPVVLKVDSPDILHKTEAGLVEIGCPSPEEARAAIPRLLERARERHPEAAVNGVLVQEMVTGCVAECIVGMKKDPQFGPTVLFGLGGIFVEVFEDVALRLAPLQGSDAAEMVRETKGFKILAGARGRPPADVAALEDVLEKMAVLVLELERSLLEIDINPLMVGEQGQGAKAADALVILDLGGGDPPTDSTGAV